MRTVPVDTTCWLAIITCKHTTISEKCCHPERSKAKPRDLGTGLTANENEMRRSFDSLRSLRMTHILRFSHDNDSICQWGRF